jgi:hypothetical protein
MANSSKPPIPRVSKAARQRGVRSVYPKQMTDVQKSLGSLMQDRNRLERLLALEKLRRGLPASDLVFVAMRNVAQHWWCTQQAILRSRAEELNLNYAHREHSGRRLRSVDFPRG